MRCGLVPGATWRLACGLSTIVLALSATPALAVTQFNPHTTDGIFTAPNEWSGRNTVSSFAFPVVGQTGGATLYVEQFQGTLYLMYDYTNSNAVGLTSTNATFDVFFQVPPAHEDYVVHITGTNTFQVFVKPTGTISSLNPNGSLNLGDPVWSPASAQDLALANFHSAIGYNNTSPNTPPATSHLMAEFDLTINSGQPSQPNGIYDPSPAFWSASTFGNGPGAASDPPISSAIFQLNPDGTTTVTPVFGADGGPVIQPQDIASPEPSGLALLGLGGMIWVGVQCRRRLAAS